MCGRLHSVGWKAAMEGLSVAHWRCTDCRRSFVLTFQEPASFVPIYLDSGVRSIEPRETGASNPLKDGKTPQPPPAIAYHCRCGEALTAHAWMYGGTTTCSSCRASILMVLCYHVRQKCFVIVPEYPHTAVEA